MKIIVTGLTSSGKTKLLDQKWDINVHNMDEIVKCWYLTDMDLISKIEKEFSGDVMKGRIIDTIELGKIVFNDPEKMEILNEIIAPKVIKYIKHQISNIDIFEMAAYIGNSKQYRKYVDKVILITRNNRDFSNKFKYLNDNIEPLKITNEKFDIEINNDFSIQAGKKKLKDAIMSLSQYKK